VPLIFSAPWMRGPVRCGAPASLIDVPTTVLSAAGIHPPDECEGHDLTPAFEDEPLTPRPYVFGEHKPLGEFHRAVDWRMVTDGRYKYTFNRGDLDELYDLSADPYETRNLIDAPPADVLTELRGALAAWAARTADPLAAEIRTEDCP